MTPNKFAIFILVLLGAIAWLPSSLHAATAYELNRDARKALHELYAKNPKAAEIANQSYATLVFPTIVKAGFIFGAQGDDKLLPQFRRLLWIAGWRAEVRLRVVLYEPKITFLSA
jgi:lipid-binding SYLF domain-containing protein